MMIYFLEQAFVTIPGILVSLTCKSYHFSAFLRLYLVAQIYDNTTRFNANKFGTFVLWKIGGYTGLLKRANGRRYIT